MTEDTASGLTNLDRLRLFNVAGGAEDEPENTPPDTSGESGPQEEQGTPAEPAEGSEASDINWQERYVEAQSWGTKASQEAAALRQVIDLAAAHTLEEIEERFPMGLSSQARSLIVSAQANGKI